MRHIYQLPPHDFMKNFSWTKALVLFVRSQSHDARPDSGLQPKKDEWAEEAYSTAQGKGQPVFEHKSGIERDNKRSFRNVWSLLGLYY